jgi:hypothetical protein
LRQSSVGHLPRHHSEQPTFAGRCHSFACISPDGQWLGRSLK